ncbi:MAG: excinuclease ABC subunit UvrC [Bdellovibrio sp.]
MEDFVKTPHIERLLDKAKTLPTKSGCYLMKDKDEKVLYIGKAKNLRARVTSYFSQSNKSVKTQYMVGHVRDFDFIMTETDAEAFVLENNLIKKHSPKYNIRMRDDKSYPYVVVDHNQPFAELRYERRVKRGSGVEVFGPFVVGSNISEVLKVIRKSFQLRDCTLREFQSRKEPCLLYQIKQCSAPCVKYISAENYAQDLQLATNFFKGKGNESIKVLTQKMLEAAEQEEFELAGIIRDNLQILKEFMEFSTQKNAEIDKGVPDFDVIAYYQGEDEVDISLYIVRNHMLLGHKNFHFLVNECEEDVVDEVMNFIYQYYASSHDTLPQYVISDFDEEKLKLLKISLKESFSIKVRTPDRKYASLMELTHKHAMEQQRVRLANEESVFVGLNKLKDLLSLKERPRKLECYDIAIFQGTSPTASQIVFIEGKEERSLYRHYNLETREEGNNDFAMMKEVISRRIKYGELPDVFIVDGGKGQVSSFKAVLDEAGIDIPVVGIAKEKGKDGKHSFKKDLVNKSEERLIIPGRTNPYILNKNKSLLKILVNMRNEAHRFSRRLHHKGEENRLFSSWLDLVDGIGPKKKQILLGKMDRSLDELAELKIEELMNLFDVNTKIAEKMKNVLNDLKKEQDVLSDDS